MISSKPVSQSIHAHWTNRRREENIPVSTALARVLLILNSHERLDVEKVGEIWAQFDQLDVSRFARQKILEERLESKRVKVYRIYFSCEVAVADESGLLQFTIMYNGKPSGTTTVRFQTY